MKYIISILSIIVIGVVFAVVGIKKAEPQTFVTPYSMIAYFIDLHRSFHGG